MAMAIIPPDEFMNAGMLSSLFDPDTFEAPVLGVAVHYKLSNVDPPRAERHFHKKGQLVFSKKGTTCIEFDKKICSIPIYWAIWIPPYVAHKVTLCNVVDFRSIYIDVNKFPHLPSAEKVVPLTPLLREVVEYIALSDFNTNWLQSRQYHLLCVLIDEICSTHKDPILLPLPQDDRMKPLLTSLERKEPPPQLEELALHIGASKRTICRIFSKETGMNYRSWRQQWRLMRSIELMSEKMAISRVSESLDFSSESAFVAFFKKYTGMTPGKYMNNIFLIEESP